MLRFARFPDSDTDARPQILGRYWRTVRYAPRNPRIREFIRDLWRDVFRERNVDRRGIETDREVPLAGVYNGQFARYHPTEIARRVDEKLFSDKIQTR